MARLLNVLLRHPHGDYPRREALVAQQADRGPSGERVRREGIAAEVVLPAAHEGRGALRRELHLVHGDVAQRGVPDGRSSGRAREAGLKARQAAHERGAEVLHALERGPGDERDAHRQVADDRLAGERARVDDGGGLEGQCPCARAEVRRGGQVVGRINGGHVVQHGVERRPQLDPYEDRCVAFDGQHGLAPAGQHQQQHHEREQDVGQRFDDVAKHRQRLLGHLAVVEPRGVHLRHGLGAAHGQHHRGRIVDLLPDDLTRVLQCVEHGVLPDDVGGGRRGIGDAVLEVSLLDLPRDGRRRRGRGERGIELECQASLDPLELCGQPSVEALVDVRAGVHPHIAVRAGERAEARWVG